MIDRIERVRLVHLQIPLKEPFRISKGEVTVKDAILVQLETASGRIGLGESSPMAEGFGYPSESPSDCWKALQNSIGPALLGQVIQTPDEIASFQKAFARFGSFAIAGAETACWDLMAQGRHASLSEMLGASPESIAMGVESGLAVGLYPTVVELIQTIETHLAEGYKRVKIKIAPGQDVELVRAIRTHFGEIDLMVDANAAYTRADMEVFRALDAFDLLMIEQPLPSEDLEGLAAVQSVIETPICIDETAKTVEATAAALKQGACKIVNIKLQRVGGLGPALEILELCRRHEVACWVGTMPELGVGQAHGLHLATLPNFRYPTDIEPSARWFVDDYVEPLLELASPGRFRIPTRPGIGFLVDAAKLQRYQIQNIELRL